jgi:replicative DNA helicase
MAKWRTLGRRDTGTQTSGINLDLHRVGSADREESVSEILLPTNTEVERLVLGSILLDDECLHAVRPVLTADDFALEKHKRIWQRITGLYDTGQPVDRVTAATALRDAGELESVDGVSYLVSLDDGLPQIPNLDGYVRILKEDASRRRILMLGDNLMRRAANREKPQDILDSIGNLTAEMVPTDSARGLVSARELVDRVGVTEILSPRIARGVPFPWEWLNNSTCGMLPSELWVLAGHTSSGKTSAAIQTAVHVARSQSKGVPIFTMEMDDVSVLQRAVWQVSRVDSERAKRDLLTSEERNRTGEALAMLAQLPLYFDEDSFSVMEIHGRLRRLRTRGPLGLIVVDYLQLLRDGSRHNTRAEAVGANARALKLMAGEFQCPVLLLSQFNRDGARSKSNETPRRPELYDLKESGDIENHANGVWFIHRLSSLDADQVPVEFILAKQRDGRRNVKQKFWFLPKYQRFDGCTSEAEA